MPDLRPERSVEEVPNARETRDDYQQVECEGYALSHFVNCKTDKVLGSKVRPRLSCPL